MLNRNIQNRNKNMDKVVQFKIQGTPITYGMKLTYDDGGILQSFERHEIRRNDRSVEFVMLNEAEKNVFVDHYRNKVHQLPVTR